MVFAGFGQLVFQVLQEKVGKVPFNLSLHVLPALWYSLGILQQHSLGSITWGFVYGRGLYSLG